MKKSKNYIIVSSRPWHKKLFLKLKTFFINDKWILIERTEEFNFEKVKVIDPKFIFITHWSKIIPENIFLNYDCILFHMTDLPFGRGGSPLQNLIVKGFENTKISGIKVKKKIDSGPIYLKKNLSLKGTAYQIFTRSSDIIFKMIIQIINKKLIPKPQEGNITFFKRRKPKESNINDLDSLEKVYDYIRMLDCEGYPHSYLENDNFIFEFTNAKFNNKKHIEANVRIIKK
tara:strand:+ start:2132 stop:2821 length:690 start_codon:yes stop_codon:yes gene_type:complete